MQLKSASGEAQVSLLTIKKKMQATYYFECFSAFALLLPCCSYMTTTFMIEAMAAANAQLRWKRREQEEVSGLQHGSRLGEDSHCHSNQGSTEYFNGQSRETNLPALVVCGLFSRPDPDVWPGEGDEPQ